MTTPDSDLILERLLSLHPKLVDLSLGRIERLMAALGHPEQNLAPVIHITGTNGKGSVLAFLCAIFEAAGLRVHSYTSPHLVRFHERIRIAGDLIDEAALQEVLNECERANDGKPITFFEITTAAAFVAFANTQADVVLLENGLGGRLDATNVIERPALTAITPVSMDHQQFLGDSLAKIATEKAGIIKPGVPCIVGPQHPDAMDVIVGHVEARQASLEACGVNWRAYPEGSGMILEHHGETISLPRPGLVGEHQIANAGHAAVLARCAEFANIKHEHIAEGLSGVSWPARLQPLKSGPIFEVLGGGWEVWLDGGHNPAAGESIAKFVAENWADKPLYMIAGMINSKEPEGFFEPLAKHAECLICVTIPDEAAAIQAKELADIAARIGHKSSTAVTILSAVQAIKEKSDEPGRVLICGSLYLAGHILRDHA